MILVTGGTGFLGSHLLSFLTEKGKKIIALKRKASKLGHTEEIFTFYGKSLGETDSLIWREADITDYFSLKDLFEENQITEIYHCAGLVSFNLYDEEKLKSVNVTGTAHLVNLALEHRVEKFCHFSSVAAIPLGKNEKIVTEQSRWKFSPRLTTYAISKYDGEREVWRGIQEGLNGVILNPSIIIGPGCWDTGSGKIISNAKKKMKYYTSGGSGVVDVRDVVETAVTLMEKNIFSERFILNSENLTFREMFTLANKVFGNEPPSIKVTQSMFLFAYYAERFFSIFNAKKPLLEKEFLKSGFSITNYSSDKIISRLNHKFNTARESFEWAGSFLK